MMSQFQNLCENADIARRFGLHALADSILREANKWLPRIAKEKKKQNIPPERDPAMKGAKP